MATTLAPRPSLVRSRPESGLAAAADLLGYTLGTLKQELQGEARTSALNIVETAIRETVRCGQSEVAARILHRLNMAAAEVLPVALSDELVMLEAELDAAEDVAEIAYLQDPSHATWDTYERKLLKLSGVIDMVLAGGRAQWKAVVQ